MTHFLVLISCIIVWSGWTWLIMVLKGPATVMPPQEPTRGSDEAPEGRTLKKPVGKIVFNFFLGTDVRVWWRAHPIQYTPPKNTRYEVAKYHRRTHPNTTCARALMTHDWYRTKYHKKAQWRRWALNKTKHHITQATNNLYERTYSIGKNPRYGENLKVPPKGPTRGFGNFAQNVGPSGVTLL